ncbi:hypothetical protein HU200_011688 [Digitaria exilis]|uniref:Uncharacterized protein n=1 Tax=Digitaria exilis TaxID=1010633 RepID=A0A835FG94_9POAL|nr:hypothetical protein HU200_011688 [Digitaria exilis]
MFGGGTRVCRRSMTPLWFLVPGGTGDVEAMVFQGNNFSRLFLFSGGDLLRRQWRGRGDLCWSPWPAHHRLLQVMMLLTRLIPRNMIYGGNPSFARVAGVGFEGCVVGAGVGRCAWEAVYLASAPSSKPSSAASTLWRLALASSDHWEAVWMVVTNGSVKSSRKMIRSFKLLCNFPFFLVFVCKRASVMC